MLVWKGVSRTYDGPIPVHALRPTSLAIEEGDYLVIVGSSGSGKSTLLNIMGLLDLPTAGSYLIHGLDLASLTETGRASLRSRFFGFVFQAFHLLPSRTVLENVELGMLYSRVPRRERHLRAVEAIDRVGLTPRQLAYPSTLSGGEQQRAAIARALAARPAVLLCDEPTGNLDSVSTESLLHFLDQLHAQGMTVVAVTHDPLVAARAQKVLSVMDGRVQVLPESALGSRSR